MRSLERRSCAHFIAIAGDKNHPERCRRHLSESKKGVCLITVTSGILQSWHCRDGAVPKSENKP